MIDKKIEGLIVDNRDELVIPAEDVATLWVTNPMYHALLVLSKVRFAKIPVLASGDRYVGVVGLADLVSKTLEVENLEGVELDKFSVADVMDVNHPTLGVNWTLEEALNKMVDVNFLPIVDGNQKFVGILPRKAILTRINAMVHNLDKKYYMIPKTDLKNSTHFNLRMPVANK
jgi:CBS domain-containing protein